IDVGSLEPEPLADALAPGELDGAIEAAGVRRRGHSALALVGVPVEAVASEKIAPGVALFRSRVDDRACVEVGFGRSEVPLAAVLDGAAEPAIGSLQAQRQRRVQRSTSPPRPAAGRVTWRRRASRIGSCSEPLTPPE